jgi:hypothetical protein
MKGKRTKSFYLAYKTLFAVSVFKKNLIFANNVDKLIVTNTS